MRKDKNKGTILSFHTKGRHVHAKRTGWTKKKWDLKNNGNNSSEIHQKGKKLVCFGKFCINTAG